MIDAGAGPSEASAEDGWSAPYEVAGGQAVGVFAGKLHQPVHTVPSHGSFETLGQKWHDLCIQLSGDCKRSRRPILNLTLREAARNHGP